QRLAAECSSIISEPWVSRKYLRRGGATRFRFISIRSRNNSVISRIHESLRDTIDYIEMAGGLFASEKSAASGWGVHLSFLLFRNWKKSWLSSRNLAKGSRARLLNFSEGGAFVFANPAAASSPCGLINSNCRSFLQLLIQRLLIKIDSAMKPRLFHSHAKNWLCRSS